MNVVRKYLIKLFDVRNLNQSESEQKKNEVIEKGRKRGKTFLISGGIIFLISMFLGLGTVDMELGLRVKKIYHGLYGFEMVKWLFLRYVPDLLLWISLIILIIGIVLMIVYRRKKPE